MSALRACGARGVGASSALGVPRRVACVTETSPEVHTAVATESAEWDYHPGVPEVLLHDEQPHTAALSGGSYVLAYVENLVLRVTKLLSNLSLVTLHPTARKETASGTNTCCRRAVPPVAKRPS